METTFKQRLLEFVRNHCNLGQNAFEQRCGIPKGTITSIREGISTKTLGKIMTAFPELNIDWLILGNGEMLRNAPILPSNKKDEDFLVRDIKMQPGAKEAPNSGELEFLRNLVLGQQEIIKDLSRGYNISSHTITKNERQ